MEDYRLSKIALHKNKTTGHKETGALKKCQNRGLICASTNVMDNANVGQAWQCISMPDAFQSFNR